MNSFFNIVGRAVIGGVIGYAVGYVISRVVDAQSKE